MPRHNENKAHPFNAQHPIRTWRHEAELTLTQLAGKAGISVAFLSDIETFKKTPSVEVLLKLHEATRLPVVEILQPYMGEGRRAA